MAAPSPEAPRYESTLGVHLRPTDPGAGPVILIELHPTVLESLERVLLVVGGELGQECDHCEDTESDVRRSQRRMWLQGRGMSRYSKQKKDNILDDGCVIWSVFAFHEVKDSRTNEGEVGHLEEPGGHLLAEHSPAIVLVVPLSLSENSRLNNQGTLTG